MRLLPPGAFCDVRLLRVLAFLRIVEPLDHLVERVLGRFAG